jgi:hypothetical protein
MPDLQRYKDDELKDLIKSDVGEKKKAVAAEILRRRRQERWSRWARRSSVLAALRMMASILALPLGRWFSR